MNESDNNRPLSTGEWVLTIIILGLPLIGLVMHFVWAFSEGNIGRRNFCRATLLILAVVLGLVIVASICMLMLGAFVGAAASAGA